MAETEGISMEDLRARVSAAGLELNEEELEGLKSLFDVQAAVVAPIHELDLGPEDLAVVFEPETG